MYFIPQVKISIGPSSLGEACTKSPLYVNHRGNNGIKVFPAFRLQRDDTAPTLYL